MQVHTGIVRLLGVSGEANQGASGDENEGASGEVLIFAPCAEREKFGNSDICIWYFF